MKPNNIKFEFFHIISDQLKYITKDLVQFLTIKDGTLNISQDGQQVLVRGSEKDSETVPL